MSTAEHILIDLDETQPTKPLAIDSKNLHYSHFQEMARCIGRIYAETDISYEEADKNISKPLSESIILVQGRRGTGKTTFITSIMETIEKASDKFNALFRQFQGNNANAANILPLGLIDPTLLNREDNLLMSVLYRIQQKVRKHHNTRNLNDGCLGYDGRFRNWEDLLRRVGKGLSEVERLEKNATDWISHELAFDNSLKSAKSNEEVPMNLLHFINLSLEILDKKAFLIAIDDIDTRPDFAWDILECLRKYFNIPQLITVISGDMDLYNKLVSVRQTEFFPYGNSQYVLPEEIRNNRSRINNLTDQYLAKVFPPHNRITLLSVLGEMEKRSREGYSAQIMVRQYSEEKPLYDLLERFYETLGVYKYGLKKEIQDALLDNPLRTLRQFLQSVCDTYYKIDENENEIPGRENTMLLPEMAEIFRSQLAAFGYADALSDMLDIQQASGLASLLDKLIFNGLFSEHADLCPVGVPWWVKNSFVVINGYLVKAFSENPGLIFHYLLKVYFLKSITEHSALKIEEDSQVYLRVKKYLRLDSSSDLVPVSKQLTGLTRWWDFNSDYNLDIISFSSKESLKGAHNFYFNLEMQRGIYKPVASLLHILGLIGDVLSGAGSTQMGRIRQNLQSSERIAIFPDFIDTSGLQGKATPFLNGPFLYHMSVDLHINEMQKWRNEIKEQQKKQAVKVSPALLSEIAARFYAMMSLENPHPQHTDEPKTDQQQLDYFSSKTLQFLQVVLVEECLANDAIIDANSLYDLPLTGWKSVQEIFEQVKVKSAKTENISHHLPLFTMMLTCPIWCKCINGDGKKILTEIRKILDEMK